ncbi:MAG: Gldg family protein, partial [Planctomycetes bacterium]|nr:Gldg family protein [Planctomycetota bacterium]
TLFFAYLLGLPFVAQAMDQALSFLGQGGGAMLAEFVGVFTHFNNLARGLLDLGNVLFFVVWTVLFLILNAVSLERRARRGADGMYAIAVVMALALGAAANWVLVEMRFPRIDMTSGRDFTVSEITSRILASLPEKIRVRYHVTPREKMPANLQDLERSVRDQFDALSHASGGMLTFQTVYRDFAEDADEERSGESEDGAMAVSPQQQLFRRIRPVSIEVVDGGRATAQMVYSALEITYPSPEHEAEIIPCVMETARPPNVTGVNEIEAKLTGYARKVTRPRQPVAAVFAPVEMPDAMAMYMAQMTGRQPEVNDPWPYIPYGLAEMAGFSIRRVMLTAEDPMPPEYDLLVVAAPDRLTPRQQYEINLALAKGKPVIIAAQRHSMEYEPDSRTVRRSLKRLDPRLDGFLPAGIDLAPGMLMTENAVPLQLPVATVLGSMRMPFPAWPMHAELSGDALIGPSDLFRQATSLRLPWASPLAIDAAALKAANLDHRVILQTNSGSWVRELSRATVRDSDMRRPEGALTERFPLAVLVNGVFPLRFQEKPSWSEVRVGPISGEDDNAGEPVDEFEAKPGTLLLFGGSWGVHRNTIRYQELMFIVNAAAHLALDADDQAIRDLNEKSFAMRVMGPLPQGAARLWKFVQVAGHGIILTVIGLAVWRFRLTRRERYRASSAASITFFDSSDGGN